VPNQFNVAVLIGSLRAASVTRKVANALIAVAPERLRCRIVEVGDLPMYNEDLDENPPPSWGRFRQEIAAVQAVLILTPEYNRSVPACLKNALDIGSRPAGKNAWNGKPAGIVSVTPYKLGAFGANHHVRQALVYLNMPAMQQPEAYIGGAAELFDDHGKPKSAETLQILTQFMAAFEQWVAMLLGRASDHGFEDFMKQRNDITAAYSSGDSRPLDAITARAGTATFFPPSGAIVVGADKVLTRYDEDAKSFSQGAKSKLEVLDCGASGQLAFWTGVQHFEGKVRGEDAKMKLRITEIFRLVQSEWKLVHRHADPQKGD
jgi:NAD(P)H-dependent FMN reductase/ketosteroid isomerase-like protein